MYAWHRAGRALELLRRFTVAKLQTIPPRCIVSGHGDYPWLLRGDGQAKPTRSYGLWVCVV